MRLISAAALTCLFAIGLRAEAIQDQEAMASASETPTARVKLDKTLRRALLKALVDLEVESAEQYTSTDPNDEECNTEEYPQKNNDEKYDVLEILKQKSTSFADDGFPAEEDTPSEENLQNSSYVETDKYILSEHPPIEKSRSPHSDYTKGFQVHNILSSDKTSAIYETKSSEQLETVETRNIQAAKLSFNKNRQSATSSVDENVMGSANVGVVPAAKNSSASTKLPVTSSNSIANSTIKAESTSSNSKTNQNKPEEVKIFQAPLVAAFTVQQDESGVPKSVVPIFKAQNSGEPSQALTLQEQLEFKQRLLEKQLAELQTQQAQQMHYLIHQRRVYEEQLRQKEQHHQHQLYFQEQQRLYQHRLQLQHQKLQQNLYLQTLPVANNNLPVQNREQNFQQYPNLEGNAQRPFQTNQHLLNPSIKYSLFQPINTNHNHIPHNLHQQPAPQLDLTQEFFQRNNLQENFQLENPQFQNYKSANLQPSVSLELPNKKPALSFRNQLQQNRLNPNVPSTTFEFRPSVQPGTRFIREEEFRNVRDFELNDSQTADKGRDVKNSNNGIPIQQQLQHQQMLPQTFLNNEFHAFKPHKQRPIATPAKQIQHLLYQSGIAGEIQAAATGNGNQDDLNIVSKVLALNVGAIPKRTGDIDKF